MRAVWPQRGPLRALSPPSSPLPLPAPAAAGTGPLFMLCWPAYSAAPASRWLAASVPAAAGALFAAVGAGLLHSDALVAGISVSLLYI